MRKNRKTPQQKPKFSFVVDGECEYWYLQMLKDNEKSLRIHIAPELPKKESLQKQYDRVLNLAKESEKVFWVIDFDVINKETNEAKVGKKNAQQKCQELTDKCKKKSNIIVVVNNPCLEFWFLQHFKPTSKFYSAYEPHLKKDLQKVLPDYAKTEKYFVKTTPDIYKRLKENLPKAITNSQKLGEFNFENTTKGMAEMYKIFNELTPFF